MKSNEPKSSAAAACPASARNTGGKERKGEREQDEGGREGARGRERENKMRAIQCRAKIHVGHSNSPTSLLPSSIFSCIFFVSALFKKKKEEEENLYLLPSYQSKVARVREAQGAVWFSSVPVPKLLLLCCSCCSRAARLTPPLLYKHASNHCIQRRERDNAGRDTSRPIRVKLHLKVKEVHILPVRSVCFF